MKFLLLSILFILSAHAEDKVPTLNLEMAMKIAAKTSAYAKSKKWNISIAIVNNEGNLIYFQRDDEAYVGSIDAAISKGKSANAFQRPTSAFVDGIKQGRIGLVTVKDVVALEGGMPITFKGKHLGGIGVSGAKSTEDEACAKAGLDLSF